MFGIATAFAEKAGVIGLLAPIRLGQRHAAYPTELDCMGLFPVSTPETN